MKVISLKSSLIILILLLSGPLWAEEWSDHQSTISRIERDIYKNQNELDVLVESKKKTRDRARIEETLQRIVEIHAELIALRKELDGERKHIQQEHPDKVALLEYIDPTKKPKSENAKSAVSPLDHQLDQLLIKIQLKFASFMQPEEKKQELVEVEQVVKAKKKKRKEREAEVYLRRKSKVKLVK